MNTSTQANIANPNYGAMEVGEEHDTMSFNVILRQLQDAGQALEDFKTEVDADRRGLSEIAGLYSVQSDVNTNPEHNEGNTSNYTENRMRMRAEGRRRLRNNRESRRQASGSFPSDASTSQNGHGSRTSSPSPSTSSSYETVEEIEEDTYDPDEPRYCVCNEVSYGEMIACDNEQCELEWFHYSCVAVTSPPRGKWYCPQCQCKMGHKRDENRRNK